MFSTLDVATTFSTLLGVVLGGLLSWLASSIYYRKAGEDLKQQSELLRKANMAVVYMLEHPDAEIEVRRDDQGNPIGLIVSAEGKASMKLATRGTISNRTETSSPDLS